MPQDGEGECHKARKINTSPHGMPPPPPHGMPVSCR